MDNITDNGTIVQGFLTQGEYLAYSSVLLFVIIIPAAILNCIILISLLLQSSLLTTVRLVLGALAAAGLLNALGLIMQRLGGIILAATLLPNPNIGVCKFVLWTILTGAACRLTFLSIFSISVLVIVVARPKYAKPLVFGIVFAGAFLVIGAVCASAFSPSVADVQYASGVSCGPLSVGTPTIVFVIIYIIIFALVPLCITLVTPVVVLCYIRKNTITEDVKIKKALARFTLFLVIGNIFNIVGIILPAAIAAQRTASTISTNGGVVEYLPYAFMSLSLLPFPILMLIFFKAVRNGIRRLFCCCCPMKKPKYEPSKTASYNLSKDISNSKEVEASGL